MSRRTIEMTDRLYDYLLRHSLREPEIFRQLREETALLPDGRMQISPEQGQFMALLVSLIGARKTIEIGTFTGYSAMWVASALPPDGIVLACDVSEEWTSIARRYWGVAGLAGKIDLRLGPALATLHSLPIGELGTYDFVFIDADKTSYAAYYEEALKFLRPGGLVALDNAFREGDIANPETTNADTLAMREVNDLIHHDPRVMPSLVPIGDGLLLALKLGEKESA
jgi:predicted O-methyltransferase YrrM